MQARAILVLAASGLTVGCVGAESAETQEIHSASAPIINGVLDTSHDAVVTLSPVGCSATIVKTDPILGTGYVLTAAHCLDSLLPTSVRLGDDFSAPELTYPVTGTSVHPLWGTTGFENDFAVVRISGVDATTPVIPAALDGDGAYAAATVTSVGFGQIYQPGETPVSNSQRYRLDTQLNSAFPSSLNYASGGTIGLCFGDSGGPVLGVVAGVEHVIGVHSNTSRDCTGGSSGRVSFVASGWLAAELDEPAPSGCAFSSEDAECSTCIVGSCCAQTTACFEDVNCVNCAMGHVASDDCGVLSPAWDDLIQCLDGCAANPCASVPPWSGIPDTTTSSSTTTGPTTTAGTTTTGTSSAGGSNGLGGNTSAGGNDAKGGDSADDDGAPEDSGCAAAPLPRRGQHVWLTAMGALAWMMLRQRRHARR